MAQEEKRGCGYRRVGGIYLVSGDVWGDCDRLPFPVTHCLACHGGIKFPRAPTEINPINLFGQHKLCTESEHDWGAPAGSCRCCQPTDEVAYILGVGKGFYKTPRAYMDEAMRLGVSKRIPAIPSNLVVGKTWVYLIHNEALFTQDDKPQMGIFAAFIPKRIEMPVWESDLTDERKKDLEKRGITPVVFKDGDPDHMPKKAKQGEEG
jgi:hypothetical protein